MTGVRVREARGGRFRPIGQICLIVSVLGGEAASAQVPADPERLINTRTDGSQAPTVVASTDAGAFGVFWSFAVNADDGSDRVDDWLMGRVITPSGRLTGETELRFGDRLTAEFIVRSQNGFSMVWDRNIASESHYATAIQELDARLNPRGPLIEWQGRPRTFWGLHAALPVRDGYALLWLGWDYEREDVPCDGCAIEVYLTILDRNGHVRHEELVNDRPYEFEEDLGFRGSLAVDGLGRLIAAYSRQYSPDSDDTDVFVRRFSPDGMPLGPPVRVNEYTAGAQKAAQVAADAAGGFVVIWQSEGEDGDLDGIVAQRFAEDGSRIGSELIVNSVVRSAQRWPQVAMDARGNLAVVWQSFDPQREPGVIPLWDIKLRLFRADGTPVGDEVLVNQRRHNSQTGPTVAFAPNGTVLVGWTSFNQPDPFAEEDVYARRFSASPGAEVCWLAGSFLRCDLGRTGGRPELRMRVGWVHRGGQAVPLLGDLDGDGRDDLCAWRPGLLRCDLDHEGRPAEAVVHFGLAGDVPLLGDADGDGRADPCVRRGRRLLCDPGHDGEPEMELVWGRPAETPLLGDLDGDGRDELCLVEAGHWRCRSWGARRFRFQLGDAASTPVLADFDGDGRADPCALEGGRLFCDPKRDGTLVELRLNLGSAAHVDLLMGNLDGL